MGIVKVNLRSVVVDDDPAESSLTPERDELKQKEVIHCINMDDDSSESPEASTELIVLGDQMFDVPYDLYDLPDLKCILSLEAWNKCLSEDERFKLSAYLPDVDQQTFSLTMNELLKGENFFFGSPLDSFFQSIKGGLCASEISCLREGLQILEKRKHYHRLSSYHNRMVHLFTDMKGIWSNCQPNVSVNERIHVWNKQKDSKPVFAVDLNALPAEEELFARVGKDEDTIQPLKRARYMDDKEDVPQLFPTSIHATPQAAPIAKPRGVLKVKPPEVNSTRTGTSQALQCESWGTRPTPKGVLKVKPRSVALHSKEKARSSPFQPEPGYEPPCLPTSRYSHGIQPRNKLDMDFNEDSHFSFAEDRGENNISLEFPWHINNVHRGNLLSQSNGSMELKGKKFPRKISQKSGVKYHNVEGLRQEPFNIDVQKREICADAMELNTFPPGCCQDKRNTTPLTSTTVSRTTTIINNEHERFLFSSIGSRRGDNGNCITSKPHEADISGIPGGGRVFPITYKRKKGSLKHNSSDSLKQKITEGHFESRFPEGTDYPPDGKIKPVKVKVKLWNK